LRTNNSTSWIILIIALFGLSLYFALSLGPIKIPLWGSHTDWQIKILIQLRLYRAITAFTTGGLLALSGALLQILLRNPLADPYILGISGGAAVANLSATLLGLSFAWLHLTSFVGSLIVMLLVFTLSRSREAWSHYRLLLTGVMLATACAAITSFLLSISSDENMRGILYWLMGSLDNNSFPSISLVVLGAGLLYSMALAKTLNLLSLGELRARSLGVATQSVQVKLFIISSLLTACAVTLAGPIAFVGLVIPHILRLLGITDNRLLLPMSVLLGGTFLIFADTLSRILIAPQQLPVGVITAFIGVPIFLYLMHHKATT
jgi:iron complex transport system permease protein